jgi:hypothetical protein
VHPSDDPASSQRSDEDGIANLELLSHKVSPLHELAPSRGARQRFFLPPDNVLRRPPFLWSLLPS